MLRILGSPRKLCDGITRRDLLCAGGLSLFGLGLADFLQAREKSSDKSKELGRSFGKARACILLFLYGSPSQIETFDTKPDAPLEVRGELKSIRSRVPGMDVGELLPNLANVMDRVTVIRSMTHPYPIHGVAYATTSVPKIDVAMELAPRDSRHWPFVGCVVDYAFRRQGGKPRPVPDNIALPWPMSTRRTGEVHRAGPYPAFLGGAHAPVWTEFRGQATVKTTKTLAGETLEIAEPYMGITPDSRFELAAGTDLPADLTLDRIRQRRSLLQQFDEARKARDRAISTQGHDRYREMAYSLIGSPQVRQALDLQRESSKVRQAYGMTLFGQSCLAARRLVEAGSRFVTVFWDEFGLAGSGWDTHWDHYGRMKKELCPGFDRGLAGLLLDLEQRGLLEETLVLCLSEHGRTPKINNAKGGGRDHWSQAYSVLLAGGGIARGKVIGKTDKVAGSVVERPVSPKDILATTYHLLGIDPETPLSDRVGRPMPLLPEGVVVPEVLA